MFENVEAPTIDVRWSELVLWDEETSAYRKKCPVCKNGILLVSRHRDTLNFQRHDRCISCGQSVRYLDEEILGTKVQE